VGVTSVVCLANEQSAKHKTARCLAAHSANFVGLSRNRQGGLRMVALTKRYAASAKGSYPMPGTSWGRARTLPAARAMRKAKTEGALIPFSTRGRSHGSSGSPNNQQADRESGSYAERDAINRGDRCRKRQGDGGT